MKHLYTHGMRRLIYVLCAVGLLTIGCADTSNKSGDTLFQKLPSSSTNVDFSNDLTFHQSFNIFTYTNFYGGGGVALGDINDDGLLDIYLVANQGSNKLYLNKGDFEFEDITEQAGVSGSKPWSTGVSMADVNGDGLLDIYVANAGVANGEDRKNELFINNGDLTFTEQAEAFGIADRGNSIHAAFFDYDRDGDLDLYLLNNYNTKRIGQYNLKNVQRGETYFRGGDRLYRNELMSHADGDSNLASETPSFTDVTDEAGIYSSEIGFGFGVSVGDINRDGWMDIYISNDFFERDYLYVNNKDGTFREVLTEKVNSTSVSSMGGDIADLDNNGYPEIFITDMLPRREARLKTIASFIGWSRYQSEVDMGYHHQFKRNTLQYNNANGTFSEIGRYAGVEATAWSWGALMADFNLDGLRDIFVPNGIYKDETNKDYLFRITKESVQRKVVTNNQVDYRKLLEMIPSNPLSNYMFENRGNMRFANRSSKWGLDEPSFSNGSAYGDLDGDGDLDLVVNNVNMETFVYRNRAIETHEMDNDSASSAQEPGWLKVELRGEPPNTYGVGGQLKIIANGHRWYAEQMPQRGFQSSVDPILHVGLGAGISTVDTLQVRWPDGRVSLKTGIEARQQLTVRQSEATSGDTAFAADEVSSEEAAADGFRVKDVTGKMGLDWTHQESSYNDFGQSPMLFHMRSTEGPPLCTGDVNGDGRDDVYVGGARGQSGMLFVQGQDGRFAATHQPALNADREAEDTACELFDADGDGRMELYVGRGSSEFSAGSRHLIDRLYQANGTDALVRMEGALPRPKEGPVPTGVVETADVDGDGDQDLFVGVRMTLVDDAGMQGYGIPVGGYLLENDGTGAFEDATSRVAPQLCAKKLEAAGVTSAAWGDLNGDGTPDLLVAGEWMPLTVFFNRSGQLRRADLQSVGLDSTRGWWQSLALADLNGDGAMDLVGGNHGLNSRFRADPKQPVLMWAGDFDRNRQMEQIFASYSDGEGPYPIALRQDLIQQLPYLKSRYPTFRGYAETTVPEIFDADKLKSAYRHSAEQLASVVGWNDGNGSFRIDSLPFRAQLAPMYGILAEDLSSDGIAEILLGGNLKAVRPQMGPYDASYGVVLKRDSTGGYRSIPSRKSGFFSSGEIRAIRAISINGQPLIVVARNDNRLQTFEVATTQ